MRPQREPRLTHIHQDSCPLGLILSRPSVRDAVQAGAQRRGTLPTPGPEFRPGHELGGGVRCCRTWSLQTSQPPLHLQQVFRAELSSSSGDLLNPVELAPAWGWEAGDLQGDKDWGEGAWVGTGLHTFTPAPTGHPMSIRAPLRGTPSAYCMHSLQDPVPPVYCPCRAQGLPYALSIGLSACCIHSLQSTMPAVDILCRAWCLLYALLVGHSAFCIPSLQGAVTSVYTFYRLH